MSLLLTQMAIILLITVLCGWLALRVGQVRVIGEIIGGILIVPLLFGRQFHVDLGRGGVACCGIR